MFKLYYNLNLVLLFTREIYLSNLKKINQTFCKFQGWQIHSLTGGQTVSSLWLSNTIIRQEVSRGKF